jgi:hypothetical protein
MLTNFKLGLPESPFKIYFLDFLIVGSRKNRKNTKNTYNNGSFIMSPKKPKNPIIPQYQLNFILLFEPIENHIYRL